MDNDGEDRGRYRGHRGQTENRVKWVIDWVIELVLVKRL